VLREAGEGAPAPERGRCAFCGKDAKLSNEHMIPYWVECGEDEGNTTRYIRESAARSAR
jgi:hypothetical protein